MDWLMRADINGLRKGEEDIDGLMYRGSSCCTLGFAKVVRLHYDGDARVLTITCPTPAHEITSGFPSEALAVINASDMEFYGGWKNDSRYHIVPSRWTTVTLKSRGGADSTRQPDACLQLLSADIPFLVCEVVDTQSRKELKRCVQEYIIGTGGTVKIVVLVRLERDKPRSKRKRDDDDTGVQLDGPATPNHEPKADNETTSTEPELDNPENPVTSQLLARRLLGIHPRAQPSSRRQSRTNHEFYPTPPTTSLILTWASILDRAQIPDDMVHKSVVIPYRILFDLFAPVKSRPEPLPGARSALIFNYNDDVLGVDMSSDSSEPESEASQPDLGG
ncbi:hypothetical protein Q9L58_008425 [Maublancomyces gigas]|uniref:Restriction endonuclease domain-containing protein n=1 Tax=Discina gigas TaxID=1032678 RepID=A0ABR3G9S9_9PEZI